MQAEKPIKKPVNIESLKDWQEYIRKGTAGMDKELLKKMTH